VATRSRLLGFDGKWAIHPSQIAVCNDVYAPTREQFDRALAMLSSYEHAVTAEGARAVVFEGEMIDEASRKLASLIVGRGRVVGLTESSP
jgi:citrate lyase subunit beta/citryl-CoA lyase